MTEVKFWPRIEKMHVFESSENVFLKLEKPIYRICDLEDY